jgi:hypothetical protein
MVPCATRMGGWYYQQRTPPFDAERIAFGRRAAAGSTRALGTGRVS